MRGPLGAVIGRYPSSDGSVPIDGGIIKHNRKCRDIAFLVLFIAFWIAMIVNSSFGFNQGNPLSSSQHPILCCKILQFQPQNCPQRLESPVYPGNLTFVEKIQRYIGFSEARASYLMSSISTHNNSAMHPSAKARTEVMPNGAIYMVKIGIGVLGTGYWLILDTGSDLTWIQCKPCVSCYDQVDPIFDPKYSSSFRNLSCTKEISCHPYFCKDRQCFYGISYGDGSISNGYIAREFFIFNTISLPPFSFRMKFGCSSKARGSWREINVIEGQLDKLLEEAESYWRQRSRIEWLKSMARLQPEGFEIAYQVRLMRMGLGV
ncbi:hypothetical protein LWI29_034700 [Acer saccharum]|uniref:Peptidase A1 domain-containing protein n=1 Tax=Acer saccharum TaxID=4024 RepID=A0AA39T0L1_ACESA|nr:hypothetical protein LWI29_034700 [Acer saccharum]